MKEIINYSDFSKIDIRAGRIVSCAVIDGSEKLLKLEVDFGKELGTRQILAGIAKWYECSELVGKQTMFVVNLEPRTMMGLESQGMLFALGLNDDGRPTLLYPAEPVDNGEGAR